MTVLAVHPDAAQLAALIEKYEHLLPKTGVREYSTSDAPRREDPTMKPTIVRTNGLRRAQLINGFAVTWTDTGAIIDGLEILWEPTKPEAQTRIGALQKQYMAAGVEAHTALAYALEALPPVFKKAYCGA
jgi:hypothetical protein